MLFVMTTILCATLYIRLLYSILLWLWDYSYYSVLPTMRRIMRLVLYLECSMRSCARYTGHTDDTELLRVCECKRVAQVSVNDLLIHASDGRRNHMRPYSLPSATIMINAVTSQHTPAAAVQIQNWVRLIFVSL